MGDSSDEQLNRLISAYNTWGKEEGGRTRDWDTSDNPSLEIGRFEERIGKSRLRESKKLKEEPQGLSRDTEESQRADYLNPALPSQTSDPQTVRDKSGGELATSPTLQEQIEQLQFEEEAQAQQHFETGFGEAATKNKALQTQIKNERNSKNKLLDNLEEENGNLKDLRLKLELKEAEHFEARQKVTFLKTEISVIEHTSAHCTSKLVGAEANLVKYAKVFKREFPEAESIESLLRSESNWRGRFEKLKQIESKIAHLQTERIQNLNKRGDSEVTGSNSSKKLANQDVWVNLGAAGTGVGDEEIRNRPGCDLIRETT